MPITFLDEEEDIAPLAPPTKRKITFLDEEETAIAPVTPQAAQPAVTQPSPYKYDPARFRPKGLVAPKAEQEVGTIEGIANAARNAFDSSRQALDIVGDVTPEEAQNIAKIEFDKQSRKLAPGYDEYQKAEGFDAVLAFAKNPIEVTSNIVAEGLAGSLPALGAGLAAGGVGAAAGSVVPVLGTAAGFTAGQVAGTFAGSLATEYGSKILEEMQSEGVDLTKPESIQGFFENEEAVTKARDKAIKRGIPVAAFDAISAGIGGKLGRVIGKQFLTKTGEAAAELGVQAGLGGGGEVAGALVAGEPIEGKAVFGEIIGEAGPGAAEVITGRMADRAARVKAEEDAKIKAAAQLSDNLEQNSAPLTAAAVKSTTATTIEQDKLAAQLEEQLDADEIASQVSGQLAVTKEPTAAPPAIKSKEEFAAIYSQVAPEELDAAEAGFTNTLATAATEEARANAQNALEAIKEVRATVTPPAPTITPAVTPAVPAAQPPITDATQEIIQPEGVRQEPQDRVEVRPTEEAGVGRGLLDTTRGQEEGQVATTTQPIISEIPTTSELVGAEPTQPTIREVLEISPIVGAEPAAIVEQEPVAPAEEAEFAELNDLMERRRQAQSKVKGVKFSKKDEVRYNELLPKYRSRFIETVAPESDPVVWKDIEGNDIKVSSKGTFYTVRDGRVRTGVAFQPKEFVTDVSPQPVSAAVVESNNVQLPEGYTKQGDLYVYQPAAPTSVTTPTVTEAVTPAPAAPVPAAPEVVAPLEVTAVPASEAGYKGPMARGKWAVIGGPMADTPEAAVEEFNKIEARNLEVAQQKSDFESVKEKLRLGTWQEADIKKATRYGKTSAPRGEVEGILNQLGLKKSEAKKVVDSIPQIYESARGTTYYEVGNVIERARSRGLLPAKVAPEQRPSAKTEAGIRDLEAIRTATPTPAVSEAPSAEPAGISVGSRIKLGKSPQTYTIEEVIPQSATERELGEQYYSVKNERTGETQVVEAKDLTPVKKKPPLPKKLARSGATSYDFSPRNALTADQQISKEQIIANVQKVFEGVPAENIEVTNEPYPDGEYGYVAAYNPNTNKIEINQAYYTLDDDIDAKVSHELGHYLYQDPRWKKAFARLYKKLTPTSKKKLDAFLEQVYADYESGDFNEEAEIRAFDRFLKDAPDNRNLFQKFIDEILDFVTDALSVFSPYFKTLARDPRRIARNIALISSERFKSGEVIEGVDTTIEPEELRLARAAEPTEETPADEARREQVAGMKIGRIITTPPGITQKTTDIIRAKFFDSTKVSPENTSQAWAYISQFMDKTDNNNNKFAGYVNQVTEEELAPEFRKGVEESMGASLFSVELANYAGRLAVQGDTKMLAYMIRNGNKMPTGEFASGVSQSGRVLNAFKKRLSSDISGVAAYETELESNVERLAAVLFGTNTPSKEQIKIAQDALTQSETIELGDANQVAADIKAVEGRTKTNLIDKVNAKISQAIDKSGRIKELEGKATRPRDIDAQSESVIESLQRSLGELPPLPQRRESDIRAIVKQDLRQNPDMGRREPWNNMLVGRLMQAGVSEEQAQTIADLTWKQHEQKAINRELKEMRKAAEEGSLAVIIDRIKNTSLEKQQSPEWKQEVIKEYLRDAGLSSQAAETAAKLYDSVISERIAAAKQKAFEDTLAKAAPWKDYASRNGKLAKDALKKIKEAIRTGVLDPEKNTESIIAALSGWTGFTKEQYQRIVELDTILNDPNQDDITKREAMDALNKIITKAKMPVRFKDALGAYYIGNALMGIPTALVNIVSPISFSIRNLMVDIAKYTKDNPAKIPVAFETFLDSMRSWYNQTSYAFKNQIYLNDVVEYLNGQNVLRETFDKGKKQWAEGKYAEGFANMAVGMTQITGRVLSALDQGAISMLENQNITRYAMAALENAKKKVPKNKIVEFANMTLDLKRRVIIENIAAGMDADRAGVLADLAVKSELRAALSEYEADTQSVLDSAINDALQSVGRNKVITIEGIKRQQKDVSDSGILSYWPIKMLEKVSEGAGKEGSGMQIFSKMVYGFALVPARTFHTAAWFSPYGFLRLAIDKYKTNKGQESPYAMSLQTEAQYRQRLTESIAGSIAMLGLFALRSGSSDEDEDKKFKIVITGNGPNAVTDKQYYDSWIKKYKPYSINIVLGDTVIPINIGRGGEALFFPIMLAGALDDYEIKSKQNLTKKEPDDLNAATEMLGSAFFALAQRGPYAAFTEPLFDASKQGRVTENLVSQLGYFGKTFVPVLGASITRNISDIINDPVDRSSIEGAIYANTPIVGPWIGTKALNALGQPIRADDWGDKLYKLGVPVVFSFPKNTPENALNELILKQGSGPTLPTRANAQKRFGDVLTDKEFETYVREYGRVMSDKMFKNRTRLANMKAVDYDDELEKYARGYSIDGIKIKGASDSAVLAVKRMRQ